MRLPHTLVYLDVNEPSMSPNEMSGDPPNYDIILEVCSDRLRRVVLTKFVEQNRQFTVRDLAHAVIEHTHQIPLDELSAEVIEEVHILLHHNHLPRLDAVGLVEYDIERQLVEPTKMFDEVQPTLTAVLDGDLALDSVPKQKRRSE